MKILATFPYWRKAPDEEALAEGRQPAINFKQKTPKEFFCLSSDGIAVHTSSVIRNDWQSDGNMWPEESFDNRFKRIIKKIDSFYSSVCIEASVVPKKQQYIIDKYLIPAGFIKVSSFYNGNSGNIVEVYHRITKGKATVNTPFYE